MGKEKKNHHPGPIWAIIEDTNLRQREEFSSKGGGWGEAGLFRIN